MSGLSAAAAHAYAEEHDRYYERLHTFEGWLSHAFFDVGAEADARRAVGTEPGRPRLPFPGSTLRLVSAEVATAP